MDKINKLSELIYKVLIQEASEEEKEELRVWRSQESVNEDLYQRIASRTRIESSFEVYNMINIERAYTKVKPVSISPKKTFYWLKYAAALVVVLLVSSIFLFVIDAPSDDSSLALDSGSHKAVLITPGGSIYDLEDKQVKAINYSGMELMNDGQKLVYLQSQEQDEDLENEMHTLSVPRGGEYELKLSDGTTIWLNSETSIQFPAHFNGDTRDVKLSGEAYFKVAHNPSKPFRVHSSGVSVEVLGTEFNVKSFAYESGIATTLLSGKVKVTSTDIPDEELVIEPGQQAFFDKELHQLQVRNVDAFAIAAWRFDRFVFRRESLENIMNTVSRWYNVNIAYSDPELKELKFNMNTYKYDTADEMFKIIEKTGKVSFELDNNIIIVKSK